ncbi:hypothetical protein AAG570_004727 [Ranatra chinensis]|uniref:Uncharacterized protein n=1 Tax=Ranatra chinensis TaxID=642074 RepID=A0ABD0Y1P5_9HEMI
MADENEVPPQEIDEAEEDAAEEPSSLGSFPLANSAVVLDLRAADERATEAAKNIEALREAIAEYGKSLKAEYGVQAPKHVPPEQEGGDDRNMYVILLWEKVTVLLWVRGPYPFKETLTAEDEAALRGKQGELMAQLSEFEGITREVERLLGLEDVGVPETPPAAPGEAAPPPPSATPAPAPAAESMPKVIVFGRHSEEDQLPKVIVCEPTDYCKEFVQFPGQQEGGGYSTTAGQPTGIPRQDTGGLPWAGIGGGEAPVGYRGVVAGGAMGGGWPMQQQQPWPPFPCQQQFPQTKGADEKRLEDLEKRVKSLVKKWKRVRSSHKEIKRVLEAGPSQTTPQVYPDRPLCKRTLEGSTVCKMDLYKQMGIPLPLPDVQSQNTDFRRLLLLVLVEHVSTLGRHLEPERLWVIIVQLVRSRFRLKTVSKRRNMFYKNKKQETTAIGGGELDELARCDDILQLLSGPGHVSTAKGVGGHQLCPEAAKKVADATGPPLRDHPRPKKTTSSRKKVKTLKPTPRPPGGPLCVFELERKLDDLRESKVRGGKADKKQTKMDNLMAKLVEFEKLAKYVKKFGCVR